MFNLFAFLNVIKIKLNYCGDRIHFKSILGTLNFHCLLDLGVKAEKQYFLYVQFCINVFS